MISEEGSRVGGWTGARVRSRRGANGLAATALRVKGLNVPSPTE